MRFRLRSPERMRMALVRICAWSHETLSTALVSLHPPLKADPIAVKREVPARAHAEIALTINSVSSPAPPSQLSGLIATNRGVAHPAPIGMPLSSALHASVPPPTALRIAAVSNVPASSSAQRSKRSAIAPAAVAAPEPSPGFVKALARYESTNTTTPTGAIRDFIRTQAEREKIRSALSKELGEALDFRASVARQLAGILRSLTGRSIDPDKVFLNLFGIFNRPSRLDLPEGTFMRTQLEDSQSLTDLAFSFANNDSPLPVSDAPDLELGLYVRNAGDSEYLPHEEVPGLTPVALIQALKDGGIQKNFASRIEAFWNTPDVVYGSLRNKFEVFHSAMAEKEALLQFSMGQLSAKGLRIAQTVIDYPSESQRKEVDAEIVNIRSHKLLAEGIDGKHFTPSGMYVLSEYPEHVQGGGTTLLYTAGSETPYREYPSIAAMLTALSPNAISSRARADFIERLPLSAASSKPESGWRVVLPGMKNDVVVFGLQTIIDNIADDFFHSTSSGDRSLKPGQRKETWLQWLAGRSVTAIESTWTHRANGTSPGQRGLVPLETVRQLTGLTDLRAEVTANYPDLQHSAWTYVRDIARTHFGVELDPGHNYLNTFDQPVPPGSSARLVSSTSLTEWMLGDLAGNTRVSIGDRYTGIYTQNTGSAAGEPANKIDLLPGQLLPRLDRKALVAAYRTQLETFWANQSTQARSVLKGNFIVDAFMQHLDGPLTGAGLAIARQIAGLNEATFQRLDLSSIDKKSNIAPGIAARWLDVYGYVSTMAMFTDANGRILLYDPLADDRTIYEFTDTSELHDWVKEQASDRTSRSRFTTSFALADLEDGKTYSGVNAALDGIADGSWATKYINWNSSPVTGDPFDAAIDAIHRQMLRDFDVGFYSDSERDKVAWMDRLAALSIVIGLGAIVVPALGAPAVLVATAQIATGVHDAGQDDPHRSARGWRSIGEGVIGGAVSLAIVKLARNAAPQGALARYASNVSASRMTPVSPGIYRHGNKRFASVDSDMYAIEYDREARSWRLTDPLNPAHKGPRIRQGDDFSWELRSLDELSGAAAACSDSMVASKTGTIERAYHTKLAALKFSRDVTRRNSYEAGVTLARENPSAPSWLRGKLEMMTDFINPKIDDPFQLGILSRWINEAERLEQVVLAERNAQTIATDMRAAGGRFDVLAQGAYVNANGHGSSGFCLPLCRAMAVAIKEGRASTLVGNLRRAIASPTHSEALALKNSLILLHSNVEAVVTIGETSILDTAAIAKLLRGSTAPSAYLVNTRSHSMLVSLQKEADGTLARYFYDPNFGLARFGGHQPFENTFEKILGTHLVGRNLGEVYEAYGTASKPLFAVQKIDLSKLATIKVGERDVAQLSLPW
jgi:hypothetical protein